MLDFCEFFAGGGMARAGLGARWRCVFANDVDPKKARSYRENWGDAALHVGDVADVEPDAIPGAPDLAWGSFPCQDLSLAGAGAGLGGARSGTFWPFWGVIDGLDAQGRGPRVVVVENVVGALSSRGGADFAAMCGAFAARGYAVGALIVDAALFVPQSRPRLFVVGVRGAAPAGLAAAEPSAPFHTAALRRAAAALPAATARRWVWWRAPPPPARRTALADVVLAQAPEDAPWRDAAATARLTGLMAPAHQARLAALRRRPGRAVGAVFRRMRPDGRGGRVQRAELRVDGLAGCLRTPAGGSSRQTLIVAEGGVVRSRALAAREAARLMGLPDSYRLPRRAGDAHHLLGDGVVVDAVAWLERALLRPAAEAARRAA